MKTIGTNYKNYKGIDELTAKVREYVKTKYEDFTFSISIEKHIMSNSLKVFLISGKTDLLTDEAKENKIKVAGSFYNLQNGLKEYIKTDIYDMLEDIDNFINSYRYVDCEPLTDYYNTNFYYELAISYDYINKSNKRVLIDNDSFVKTYADLYRQINNKRMKYTHLLKKKEYVGIMEVKSKTYKLQFKDEKGLDRQVYGEKNGKFTRILANGFEKLDGDGEVYARYEFVE